ncbi:MAG: hypothetical protein AAF328_03735 [Planctomycetota bacterium]
MAIAFEFLIWFLVATLALLYIVMCGLENSARRIAFGRVAQRSCAGFAWRARCRRERTLAVRSFLESVVDEMGLPRKLTAKLRPDDRIMDIYRWIYPPNRNLGADALELECLSLELERRYRVSLADMFGDDVRFGDLFDRLHRPRHPNAAA